MRFHPESAPEPLTWLQLEKQAFSEDGIDIKTYIDAMYKRCANQTRELARLNQRADAMRKALHECIEHMEWSTPQGRAAWETANALINRPAETPNVQGET